jgi:hypothetical protein
MRVHPNNCSLIDPAYHLVDKSDWISEINKTKKYEIKNRLYKQRGWNPNMSNE